MQNKTSNNKYINVNKYFDMLHVDICKKIIKMGIPEGTIIIYLPAKRILPKRIQIKCVNLECIKYGKCSGRIKKFDAFHLRM